MMPTADTTVNCQKGIDVVAIAMLSCREGQVESTGRLEGVGWVARQSIEAGGSKTALTARSGSKSSSSRQQCKPSSYARCHQAAAAAAAAASKHTRLYGMMGEKRMMSTSFQPSCSMALSMMSHRFHFVFSVFSTQPRNRYLQRAGRSEGLWAAG